MDNPGSFALATFNLTGPGTQMSTPFTNFAGIATMALQARLA